MKELEKLKGLLDNDISKYKETEIRGSGYVVDCLVASIWCFLNSRNYEEAVLKAVNLGEDTDTTGTVTGGLAGLYDGFEAIPLDWVIHLARSRDIEHLTERFYMSLSK